MSEVAADRREYSRDSLCSSIAERGRVAGAIKACFASIGSCGLAAVGPAFAQAPENGDQLASMMIKQAESGSGRVDMHRFGDGACSWPKACLRPMWREDSFPAIRSLTGKPTLATACGLSCWRTTARRTCRIYAIKQGVLRWDVPENARVGDAMVCSDTADISTSAAVGSGPLFQPVPRSR